MVSEYATDNKCRSRVVHTGWICGGAGLFHNILGVTIPNSSASSLIFLKRATTRMGSSVVGGKVLDWVQRSHGLGRLLQYKTMRTQKIILN